MNKKNILILLFFSFAICLNAVQVKKIEVVDYKDFQKGELKGTSIDSQGRLFLGPEINDIKGPEREYYLSLDVSGNGDIYIGTGHKSILFRLNSKTNSIEEIFQSDQLDFYALLVKDENDIYVGSSPNGKVYHIGKNKKAKVVFDPAEKFIWDIKADKDGNIICAMGNSGAIYKIEKTGEVGKIYDAEDSHLISLFITRENSILTGSGDRGILYRIENRKVKVIHDSPLEEIRAICEDKEGNIFFAATRGIVNKKLMDSENNELFFSKQKDRDKKELKEKSILYCLHTNGIVEQIWSSMEDYVYTICYDQYNDSIIVGTGNSGRVFRVNKDGGYSLVFESNSAQIYKIITNKNGFIMITNNMASIAFMKNNLNDKGSYLSEIYDLEVPSRLGKIYWDQELSKGMKVVFFVRTGNSNIADKTWSDWSPPFTDPQNSNINVNGFRYFQIKVMLNSSSIGGTPYLNNFRIFYLQTNLKPLIKNIEVKKPDYKIPRQKIDKKTHNKEKCLLARWNATDPNNDELKYSIYIRKLKDKNWIPIKKNSSDNKIKIYTELFEDDFYVMKVIADDSLSNPPSTSKLTSITSKPFVVDSTAPVLTNLVIERTRVKFVVSDKTSLVSEVLYSYDGELWYPLIPEDMINDSKSEIFAFQLKEIIAKKVFFIRVVDEFGNSKVFQREL
ncbi:MAG: hypothetical protein KAT17_06665 [Candidatus Aminicenantes bacterium]|nr:hypothetical protein [Candidatus Aminicenantes bacterium]